jgi:hypothetical protein
MALFQLKQLQRKYGFACSVLVSDLGAFLDRAKCPWAQLKVSLEISDQNLRLVLTKFI